MEPLKAMAQTSTFRYLRNMRRMIEKGELGTLQVSMMISALTAVLSDISSRGPEPSSTKSEKKNSSFGDRDETQTENNSNFSQIFGEIEALGQEVLSSKQSELSNVFLDLLAKLVGVCATKPEKLRHFSSICELATAFLAEKNSQNFLALSSILYKLVYISGEETLQDEPVLRGSLLRLLVDFTGKLRPDSDVRVRVLLEETAGLIENSRKNLVKF